MVRGRVGGAPCDALQHTAERGEAAQQARSLASLPPRPSPWEPRHVLQPFEAGPATFASPAFRATHHHLPLPPPACSPEGCSACDDYTARCTGCDEGERPPLVLFQQFIPAWAPWLHAGLGEAVSTQTGVFSRALLALAAYKPGLSFTLPLQATSTTRQRASACAAPTRTALVRMAGWSAGGRSAVRARGASPTAPKRSPSHARTSATSPHACHWSQRCQPPNWYGPTTPPACRSRRLQAGPRQVHPLHLRLWQAQRQVRRLHQV